MGATFLITSRETLEAALIVSIILAYLKKTKGLGQGKFVWYGVISGIALSIILAYLFENFFGGFSGAAEALYEGITMLVAAGLITWMIIWLISRYKNLRAHLENKVASHVKQDSSFGLFALAFVATAREGIETVIFLQAAALNTGGQNDLLGGILGVAVAVILGYLVYRGVKIIALRHFFTVTGVLFLLFAAGLLAHGIHELEEAGIIPIIKEHLWDINYILNENEGLGAVLKGLFGYNGNPSLVEVISYLAYLGIFGGIFLAKRNR